MRLWWAHSIVHSFHGKSALLEGSVFWCHVSDPGINCSSERPLCPKGSSGLAAIVALSRVSLFPVSASKGKKIKHCVQDFLEAGPLTFLSGGVVC